MNNVILSRDLKIGHTVSTVHGGKGKIIGGVKGKFDILIGDKVLREQSWICHIKDKKGKERRDLTLEAIRISELPESDPIDVGQNPFVYNKEFDPENPTHFAAWNKYMRPKHISPEQWLFQLGRLKLLLQTPSVKTEEDRNFLILGWKSENGLI